MFTKTLFNKIFVAAVIFAASVFAVQAVSQEDIVYPVTELENCKDKQACMAYCEDSSHMDVCVRFAEKHNLISKEEAARAKKFSAVGAKGPGGCASADSCESYCNDINHINECLAFAEKTGILPPDELAEARKVQAVLAAGATLPGGCRNKDECEAYCESPDHMEECITFAEAAGFIPPDELQEARKVLAAVKKGVKPPPCRGKNSCDVYCSRPENMESCIEFAEAADLIPADELADAKKMLSAIKKGVKPPSCGGRAACDAYCAQEGHFEECLNFAEAAGFIAPEEVEMARKTGGKGPGNCKGREECESFCQNPANGEVCFNFAKEHGLLKEEDLRRMEEGKQQILQMVDSAPPEIKTCLEGVINVEGIRSGSVMPREDMGDSIKTCFEQFMPKPERFGGHNGEGTEGFQPPPGFEGQMPPGFESGQMSPEGFQPPEGFKPPERMMPPEGFDGQFPMNKEQMEGFHPPEGFQPPSGEIPQEYQRQYEQQYQQQYQQQMEQQVQPPPGSFVPPEGIAPPPPSSKATILDTLLGVVIAPFIELLSR